MNHGRAHTRSVRRVAALVATLLVASANAAQAQVRDTLRADTTRVDSLAADTVPRDTVPPPVMVPWPVDPGPGRFATAVREWNRDQLLDEGAITLLDLLWRIPGVTIFRSGVFLQPEAASVWGSGASRLRVEWNGFVLDPLVSRSLDLSTIELVQLDHLRIERRGDVLLIRIRSDAPATAEPYSRIEAGVGEPRANLFRGILLAPRFLIGPIGLAVERVELEGSGTRQPADVFSGWARWGVLGENRGIEMEYRNGRTRREAGSPRPEEFGRSDLMIRARNRFADGVVGEAYFGRTSERIDGLMPDLDDSLQTHVDRRTDQAGLRLGLQARQGMAEAGVRWRNNEALPRLSLDAAAAGGLGRFGLNAEIQHDNWRGSPKGTSYRVMGSVGILSGVRVFGEYAGGWRGAPFVLIDSTGQPHLDRRTVARGGLEVELWGIQAAAAGLRVETNMVSTFGLPGDTMVTTLPGGEVTGWEGSIRLPLLGDWLAASGSYTTWLSGQRWVYVPESDLKAFLLLNASPLESGNLQFIGRFGVFRRGSMLAPPLDETNTSPQLPTRTVLNAYIEIRIIDIRIFARFDDMGSADPEDLPGLPINGPRLLYGVKWNFWN